MSYTHLTELPSTHGGGKLGRHIDRTPHFTSRCVTADQVPAPSTTAITWTRHCPPFDQGQLSSCTGNAGVGALMTEPLWQPTWAYTETDAIALYSDATHYNPDGSVYPPTDDGSTGPCVADALEHMGTVSNSVHATDLTTARGLLTLGPCIFGVNWMDSFDQPLPTGECPLTPEAQVRGGHEIEAFGDDPINQRVWFYQSWGPSWGGLGNGTFWFSYQTLTTLFEAGADASSFTLASPVVNPNFP